MVVIAAAVCGHSGKALFSRQFVDISRSRIESLLDAFPRLLDQSSSSPTSTLTSSNSIANDARRPVTRSVANSRQHTFLETDTVRYVFHPMEELYMLLLTDKSSNIIADIDTVHLLAQLVRDGCGELSATKARENAFEIIWAFEEVISSGMRENVTFRQVKDFLLMESQHEQREEEFIRNQEHVAAHDLEKIIDELRAKRKHESRQPRPDKKVPNFPNTTPRAQVPDTRLEQSSRLGDSSKPKRSGMVLVRPESSSMPATKLSAATQREEFNFLPPPANEIVSPRDSESIGTSSSSKPIVTPPPMEINIEERIKATIDNDGGLQEFKVIGNMAITLNQEIQGFKQTAIQLNLNQDPTFKYQVHSHWNKAAFRESGQLIPARDQFAVGVSTSVLKWRWQSNDEADLPLLVHCWPQVLKDGSIQATVEYELQRPEFNLLDVCLSVPFPDGVANVDNENSEFINEVTLAPRLLKWKIPVLDSSNSAASIDVRVTPAQNLPAQSSDMFPVQIDFSSANTFSGLKVTEVMHKEEGPLRFTAGTLLRTHEVQVVVT